MFRLAEELTATGMTVVSTMTTKIFVGQMERAPASLLLCDDGSIPGELEALLAEHRHVLVGCRIGADREKVEGVPPEVVDRIAAAGRAGNRLADVIIVEADGSRRLPLKAPAEHEPVVPASTTILVPLVGLDVLGQPLDAEHVHRPQLVSALANASIGEPVTPQVVVRVLAHAEGGAKALPAGARLTPLLNKADLDMDGGQQIARLLLEAPEVDEVLIGAAGTTEPVREAWGRVAAVVLAAGEASRFGRLKQVMPWRDPSTGVTRPLVAHVVQQALDCNDVDRVVVTSGSQAGLVDEALAHYGEEVTIIRASKWAEGQSRSVQAGLHAARHASALGRIAGEPSAVVFLLADQPGVSPDLLSALARRHRETRSPIVAPRYQGRRGNPVLFDRATFAEFENLQGDAGARSIIARHAAARPNAEIAWVDWPTDDVLKDIDTPEDFAAAQTGD
jgi:molybdenum cofactor cytidylyltransferase